MRIATRFLTLVASVAFVGFVYQQVFVEGAFGPAAMLGTALLGVLVVALRRADLPDGHTAPRTRGQPADGVHGRGGRLSRCSTSRQAGS